MRAVTGKKVRRTGCDRGEKNRAILLRERYPNWKSAYRYVRHDLDAGKQRLEPIACVAILEIPSRFLDRVLRATHADATRRRPQRDERAIHAIRRREKHVGVEEYSIRVAVMAYRARECTSRHRRRGFLAFGRFRAAGGRPCGMRSGSSPILRTVAFAPA